MAFAGQSNYRAAQSPQYQHQQYSSPQRSFTAEYDYAPEQQDFNGRHEMRPVQQYPDSYISRDRGQRHDRNQCEGTNNDNMYRGDYGNPYGRNKGGVPVTQQARRGYLVSEPRPQGQPRSKSRPPERDRHQNADRLYPNDGSNGLDHYQQAHPPERKLPSQSAGQNDNGYGFEKNDHYHRKIRAADQQYGTSAQRDYEPHNSQPRIELSGKDDFPPSSQNPSDDYEAAASNPYLQNVQGVPGYAHNHPPIVSSKSETSQRSKFSNGRVNEASMSPDTVAWDNPFPTFPMRPKKGANFDPKNFSGPKLKGDHQRGHDFHDSHDDRPQTASSKSSSYTIPQPQDPHVQNEDYFDRNGGAPLNVSRGLPSVHERPSTSHSANAGSHIHQLRPPVVNGRRSEDNRARPSMPEDPGPNPLYERSRTMPAAISDTNSQQSGRLKPAVQTNWQEPGPVDGYYGPEDRGYTPTSPSGAQGYMHHQRPFGHAALPSKGRNVRQPHTPQDSLGDVLDNYYDASAHEKRPSQPKISHSHGHAMDDDEMPNFDAVVDNGRNHIRKLSADKDFSSHQIGREHLQGPLRPRDGRINGSSDAYHNEPILRSRSQPNFRDKQPPGRQAPGGFDFGVPEPSSRPPATAPAYGDPGFQGDIASGFPNYQHMPIEKDHFPREPRGPGYRQAAGRPYGDRNHEPVRSRPPVREYEAEVPPDRLQHSLQDGRPNGSFPRPYHGQTNPNQFRPPLPSEDYTHRAPNRPPGARPYGADGNMNNVPPPVSAQNQKRLPNGQNGQNRPPDGRSPPPIDRTIPPSKSPVNPDALPAHPAPVRAGLTGSSPVNQAAKPAPVRQYNATASPMQLSSTSHKPGASNSAGTKRENLPVTHQELDRLKQLTARNPDDMATQLLLAKKFVEAAVVLVDERADARSRSKTREKYAFDAHKIVKKLSGNGYTEATFYLADCYTRGSLGLESDTREAFKLYQSAAKAGHPQAAYRVAVCCEIGQEEGGGTSRDAVKAMQWYKRAATLGDTPAMYKMGIISLKGLLGQPKNPKEALIWLKRAAERADVENPHALHELALLHEKPSGSEGINKDEAYSMRLFTQSANLGYKFSQYRLGSAYEYGLLGCPVDPRQSIAWYSKAAVQEEHQSELALSGWYLTGSEGILQQSDTEAYLWARKAAQAGLAKAEYAMGYFTEVGIGAPANLEDAKRWYWRAASQNFPKARDRLEDLRKGGPTKRKERVSRSNIRKSTEGECIVM